MRGRVYPALAKLEARRPKLSDQGASELLDLSQVWRGASPMSMGVGPKREVEVVVYPKGC